MRNIEIDLAEPFEKILARVLSLPSGCRGVASDRLTREAELRVVVRRLYEAANGRLVETKIGFIPIAPPAFGFLKAKPFRVGTQTELLIEAAARLIRGRQSVGNRRETTDGVAASPKPFLKPVPVAGEARSRGGPRFKPAGQRNRMRRRAYFLRART